MESIRKYIARFLKRSQFNIHYGMCFHEAIACESESNKKPIETIGTIFEYGYAKGYRAALAEMKKGGAASCRG